MPLAPTRRSELFGYSPIYKSACVVLSFLAHEHLDGFPGSVALVSIAQVRTFAVVVARPGIEVVLQGLDRGVLTHLRAEELVDHCAVEALDEAGGARRATRVRRM
jgi:hypothetical protein